MENIKESTQPIRKMRFRRNPLPRRPIEIVAFLIVVTIMPTVALYDMIIVMPAIFKPNLIVLIITIVIFAFISLNTIANMVACMIVDTSVDYKQVEIPQAGDAGRLEWRYCKTCVRWAPPRSWHCRYCGTCMLKRDHHCVFVGYCVGHQNHRFFFLFVLYFFVFAINAVVYNIWFMLGMFGEDITIWTNLPMPTIQKFSFTYLPYCHIFICLINFFGIGLLFGIYGYHLPLIFQGNVSALRGKENKYSGSVCFNLKSVFGKRVYIAWIFPLIKSELPDDGYTWTANPALQKH